MSMNKSITKKLNNQSRLFSYTLAILWMGLIFYMSHQNGGNSSRLSIVITEDLIKALGWITGKEVFDFFTFHFLTRKASHFLAYLVLGVLVYRCLPKPSLKNALLTLALVTLYAATDEYHQTFVIGRSGEARDILLDTSGAFLGVFLYYVFRKKRSKLSLK